MQTKNLPGWVGHCGVKKLLECFYVEVIVWATMSGGGGGGHLGFFCFVIILILIHMKREKIYK